MPEVTGNTVAIVELLKPHVGRVVIANLVQVRVIAEAKAKTGRIDAAALARLHAAGSSAGGVQPDEATELLRDLNPSLPVHRAGQPAASRHTIPFPRDDRRW